MYNPSRSTYRIATNCSGRYPTHVVKQDGTAHPELTLYANKASDSLSKRTVPIYLAEVLRVFTWVQQDTILQEDQQSLLGPIGQVRRILYEYLTADCKCVLRQRRDGKTTTIFVRTTNQTRVNVKLTLAVMKHFYATLIPAHAYKHENPLVSAELVRELKQTKDRIQEAFIANKGRRSPYNSGGVDDNWQHQLRYSTNYFQLANGEWKPRIIADALLPARILHAGRKYGWGLRETIISRMLFESGERLINYRGGDSATKQHDFFLEYKGVEPNQKGATGVELWFADIARFNICHPEQYRDNRSKAFQKSYGIPNLLYVRLGSTLCGGRRLSASLLDLIRERRRNDPDFRPIYFHPHGLYTICQIGRSATRILCITACRANELLQIDVSADCLMRIEADHLPTPAYAFQAIPKLRQDPEPFFIDERCLRFLKEQAEWLASFSPGGVLNSMQASRVLAKHKRQNIRPYIFQLPGKKPVAIDRGWIQAAVRFMIHGRLYKTTTGIPFQPALHDLRHLTSTVLRSNDVPLPVIAKMLKQRDHTVTEYYSEPTQTQIISAMQGLHLVTIGIGRTSGTRTASELKQQLADANGVVGALTKVSGGTCGVGSPCAARFACLGCAGLIPDHRERQQILRNQARLKEDLRYFSENGNMAEVRKCEQALVDCERVLAEMDLQEEADQDAGSAPTTVNTRKS